MVSGEVSIYILSHYLHSYICLPPVPSRSVCNVSWGQYSCLMSLGIRVLVGRKGVTPVGPAPLRHQPPQPPGNLIKATLQAWLLRHA